MSDSQPPARLERTILVLDDEPAMLLLMKELLAAQGWTVTTAADAEEALKQLREQSFAVALLDKNLPGELSGLDVLRAIRTRSPLTRAMIHTAFSSVDSAIEALTNGAFDYIEKPAPNDMIIEKVERAWTSFVTELDRQELFRKYETLFEIVPGIVWFMTQDGMLKRINKEGAAMLGYAPEELLDQPYERLLRESEVRESVHWAFKERRTGDRGTRHEIIELKTRSGGSRLFEMSATGAYDRQADEPEKSFWGTLGVGWDITDHALAEEQLQQARRMEAIGRVAGAVAHDFNNLLSVILNNAAFLREQLTSDDPRRPDVDEIDRAAHRAADLTRQLLAFSRKQVVRPRPLEISDVVNGMEGLVRRLLHEDIELAIRTNDARGTVLADASQLEQVIINLVANARDAMPSGGHLRLELDDIEVGAELADSAVDLRTGPYVLLTVADDGSGISPEVREHLFEPFFTTKPPGKGTGLGLATVYGVVRQADGHIQIDSAESQGTTVRIYLPQVEEAAREVKTEPPERTALGGSETVLVVEDEAMVRRMARRILERKGYVVRDAANGEEALQLCDQEGYVPDLLVTDVVMPRMGGTDLVAELRKRAPNVPVLYMSGYLGTMSRDDVMLEDNAQFLQKPFTAGSMLSMVRSLLDPAADEADAK